MPHDPLLQEAPDLRVPYRGALVRLSRSDVRYVAAEGDYVRLFTAARSYLVRITMAGMEAQLAASFVRIHRSLLFAEHRITGISQRGPGLWAVTDEHGALHPVGRRYLASVRERVDARPVRGRKAGPGA